MLSHRLQCLIVLLLAIITNAAVKLNACHKLPADDYETITNCCRKSPIEYHEEVMAKCRLFNTTKELSKKDLILMNVCETYCYLNHFDVVNENGTMHYAELVDFLKIHLPAELHPPLVDFVAKCLPEVEFPSFRIYPLNCHWHYTAIIDCIQSELFVNCPDSEKVSSPVCENSREFVRSCGIIALREAFNRNGERVNETHVCAESLSYYDSHESSGGSYSQSYEYESEESNS